MKTTRRDALKFIGFGIGGVAIAPSVLLQACKEAAQAGPSYTYQTFSPTQAATLRLIQDTILPKTDTPSASEVGSVEFADTYIHYTFNPEDKARMLHQLDRFAAKLQEEHGASLEAATPEQIDAMFRTYFSEYKAPEANGKITMEIEGNKIEKEESEESAEEVKSEMSNDPADLNTHNQVEEAVSYEPDPVEINKLLTDIRWLTFESYFASEQIGENVLNYVDVPGKWVGQYPMSEVPKGRAWSL